jgi:hypothetical protein
MNTPHICAKSLLWHDLLCPLFRFGVLALSSSLPLSDSLPPPSASLATSARNGELRACRCSFVGRRWRRFNWLERVP